MIRVTCACGKSDEVRDELAGKKLKCPVCKQQVTVPGEAPLLLDDPPPAPPKAPEPEPEPKPEPVDVEPAPVRILPWKKLAYSGFAAAGILFVVAVLAVATRPGPPPPPPKPLISAIELEILRRDLADRELESKTLREIALKGDDPKRFEGFLKQLDDLRKERDKLADASARAEERARGLAERVQALEKNLATPPPPPAPVVEKKATMPEIVERCMPAVVIVRTERGAGAGFFVTPDGLLLTNHHVVSGAKALEVDYMRDGRKVSATSVVKAVDLKNDLALVQVPASGPVQFLAVEVDVRPRVGESVLALGSPGLGGSVLDRSVTSGIVSGDVREIEGRVFLQTTAAINPGNSGGPLLSETGRVYGVVTAKAVGKEGIGFAVPAGLARALLDRREDAEFKIVGSLEEWEKKRGVASRFAGSEAAIPLPGAPARLHVDEDKDRILALDHRNNALHVVSIAQKKVLKTVPTGADPVDFQVLPGTRTAWVANAGSRNMIKIDLDRGEVVETVALSAVPIRITLTKTQMWIAGSGTLFVYSLQERKEYAIQGILPGPTAYEARRDKLFVVTVQGTVEFDPDRFLTLLKEQTRLRGLPNELRAVQQEIAKTIKTHPIGMSLTDAASGSLQVHEKSGRLFYDRVMYRLDKPDQVIGTFKTNPYSMSENADVRDFIARYNWLDQIIAVSPDGKWAVNGTHVYDVERFTAVRELPVPSPAAAFSKDSRLVWAYDFVNKALIAVPVKE